MTCLSLVACGGGGSGGRTATAPSNSSAGSSPGSSAPGATPAPAPAPAPATPPVVTATQPTAAFNDRATTITLTGTALSGVSSVELDAAAGPVTLSFQIRSATEVEVQLPSGLAAGARDLLVNGAAAGSLTVRNLVDAGQPGAFPVGSRDVTINGASGDTPSARIYYPAMQGGSGATPDATGGPYPVVCYGHGFKPFLFAAGIDYRNNRFIAEPLASFGYVVICVDNSQNNSYFGSNATGQANSQRDADDLIAALDALEAENTNVQSPLFGLLDTNQAVFAGHSRGGDAALMAAAGERANRGASSRVRAVAAFAAPSVDSQNSNAPLQFGDFTATPALIVGASEDSIAPFSQQQDIFALAGAGSMVVELVGGNHSQFKDSSDRLLSDGQASLALSEQQEVTQRTLIAFLSRQLRGAGQAAMPYLAGGPIAANDARLQNFTAR